MSATLWVPYGNEKIPKGAFHEQGWTSGEKYDKNENEKSSDFVLFSFNLMFEQINFAIGSS